MKVFALLLVACVLPGCKDDASDTSGPGDPNPVALADDRPSAGRQAKTPQEAITPELLRTHTQALSDDAMEGRRPGTPGAQRAVQYIVTVMKDLGLEPAGEEGWTQRVPMRAVATDAERTELAFRGGKGSAKPLKFGTQWVGSSFEQAGTHEIDAPLVFAGYGITAPEQGWDDYAGLDVQGKVVVVFVGDPPTGDERFGGDAMTYAGRWTYKFERARQAGATGCLVIHETEPASYGWNVVESSWSSERFHVVEPDGAIPPALGLEGWISSEAAEALARRTGSTLRKWHAEALKKGFHGRDLGVRMGGTFVTTERRLEDVNVIGKITGDTRPDEAVLITAHWDHLGTAVTDTPDQDAVFNGAIDNASGVAGMLAVAAGIRARTDSGDAPDRSILFVATTAEEQGLLGSEYYATHPLLALSKTAGVVNLDSMNVHGRTKTVQVIGSGQSSLEDVLLEVARTQDRSIVPDEHPESGRYYRSDHFSFAKRGVPALYFHAGADMEHGGVEAGEALAKQRAQSYHTVSDEFDPTWSFDGTEQDAEAVADLVLRVADTSELPQWKPTSEFASIRR
jgi:Zn-dependent M28 family amino/carboxypeptidase